MRWTVSVPPSAAIVVHVRARPGVHPPALRPSPRNPIELPAPSAARRLRPAPASGAGATAAGAVAMIALAAGALALAGVLALATVGLLLDTRRRPRLAGHSRVGARSEDAVAEPSPRSRRKAGAFAIVRYRGRGEIDSIATAPTGLAFAIETKTRTFRSEHLANTREMAAWLCRHRRRWCRAGALAVLCVVGARSLERVEDDVLIVSVDRLLPALRVRAGTTPRRGSSPHRNHTADRRPLAPKGRPVAHRRRAVGALAATELRSPQSGSSRFPIVRSSVGPGIACVADGSRARREPPSQEAIVPERPGGGISSPLLSAHSDHADGRGGTIASAEGRPTPREAIARRMPAASSGSASARRGEAAVRRARRDD